MAKDVRTARPQLDYNRGFVTQALKLGSHPAQTIFEKTFKETNMALFSLGVVLRSIATDEQAAATQKVVDGFLKAAADEIAAEKARLDKLLEENGIQEKVEFTAPKEVTAEISSPRSSRYLMLIRDIDKLVSKMTALWLCGVLADAQYNKGNHQWISRMRNLSVQLRNVDRRAKSSAGRKQRPANQPKAKADAKKKDLQADIEPREQGDVAEIVESAQPLPVAASKKKTKGSDVMESAATEAHAETLMQEQAVAI